MWMHTFEGCVAAENQVLCSYWTSVAGITYSLLWILLFPDYIVAYLQQKQG